MILLSGKSNLPVGFIYNNILASKEGLVIGVVLGHCVFGPQGKPVAKYFRQTLFALDGKILAKSLEGYQLFKVSADKLVRDAWQFISLIRDHSCPFINPTNDWSATPFLSYFNIEVSVDCKL